MAMLLARAIHVGFSIYELGLLAYVFSGWVAHPAAHRLRLRLARWYEPALAPIRNFIPFPQIGHAAIDLSPIILFIALSMLKNAVLSLLVPAF